jgi:hypothetical protein
MYVAIENKIDNFVEISCQIQIDVLTMWMGFVQRNQI